MFIHYSICLKRVLLALFASTLLGLSSAHAQSPGTPGTPSYIGPWVYQTYAAQGAGGVQGYSSESAAMDATLEQVKSWDGAGSYCNEHVVPSTIEWYRSNLNSGPVEGTETAATRSFVISMNMTSAGSCTAQVSNIGFNVVRNRLVCSSDKMFANGKCNTMTSFNYPSQGEGNLGPQCPNCGEPINPGTGNMWHVESDFAGTGAASSLAMQRVYNSVPYSWSVTSKRLFGRSWTSRYDAALTRRKVDFSYVKVPCWRREDGVIICAVLGVVGEDGPIPAAVSIVRGDGNELTFNLQPGLVWQGDAKNSDRLNATYNADKSAVVAWDYVQASSGATERFASDGRLLSITEVGGSRQLLTYSDGLNADTSAGRYPADAPPCALVQTGPVVMNKLPLCVTDNWERQLNFRYDWAGRIVEMVDPANQSYFYEYDGATGGCNPANPASAACIAGNLTKVTYPDGSSHTYVYNEAGRINGGATCPGYAAPLDGRGHLDRAMTGLIDENGNRYISWTYDCVGRALSSELAGGVNKVTLAYQIWSSQQVSTTVTHYLGDPMAPTTTVSKFENYPVRGVMMNGSVSGPCVECGAIAWIAVDANGNVNKTTDFNNKLTDYYFDLTRNLETLRNESMAPYSSITRQVWTTWHPTFRLPTVIAEPKRITTFTYDSKGNLLTRSVQATSDPQGHASYSAAPVGSPQVWTYTYNNAGQVLTIDGPRTDVADITTYSYDAAGNLSTVTNALGHVTTYSDYDGAGRVRMITAPGGKVTSLQYTPRGKLSSSVTTVDGISATTAIDYDGVGNVTKVTMPDTSTLSYTYDLAHRLTGITDNLGNQVTYTLDLTGNRTSETLADPSGTLTRKITRIFDTLNRVQQVTGGVQ